MILILATILLTLTNFHYKGNAMDVKNYVIKKVKDIETKVTEIDFDIKGNTYVRGESTHLYVLDPKNEKLLYSKYENYAKAIVTRDNFTYIVLSDSQRLQSDEKDHSWHKIYRMRLDNFELQYSGANYYHIKTKKYHDAYCIDSDNILYFNGGPDNWGLKLLRPDAMYYTTVETNFKPFYFNACEENQYGTLIFTNTELKYGGLSFLTRKEKLSPSPKARHSNNTVSDYKVWNNYSLWVQEHDDGSNSVRGPKNMIEILPATFGYKYYFLDNKFSQRFYIIADHGNGLESWVHYITKNLAGKKVSPPLVPSIVKGNKRPIYVEDKQGTAYFAHRGSDGYQRLLVLKSTDTEFKEIFLLERNIYDLAADQENNIWLLLNDGLYTMNPENPEHDLVEIKTESIKLETDRESFLKVKKTDEIYIATKNGVFIVSKTQRATPSA